LCTLILLQLKTFELKNVLFSKKTSVFNYSIKNNRFEKNQYF
jgi:hypothetical protein